MRTKCLLFALALSSVASASEAPSPKRTQVVVAAGPSGMGSTWRGDPALIGSLLLGVRFLDLFSIEFTGRLGYAAVDQRTLTYFGLGGTIYGRLGIVRPWARIAVVHQHEETIAALHNDFGGALLGIGDGIRHRAGFSWSLGADVPFAHTGRTEFFAGMDALATVFPDPRGPVFYMGGGLWVGMHYSL